MSSLLRGVANFARDQMISSQELAERESLKGMIKLTKTATLIAVVVEFIFFVALPSVFTLGALCFTALAARELYLMADNALEILDNAGLELMIAASSNQPLALAEQIGKNTLFVGPLFQMIAANATQ